MVCTFCNATLSHINSGNAKAYLRRYHPSTFDAVQKEDAVGDPGVQAPPNAANKVPNLASCSAA